MEKGMDYCFNKCNQQYVPKLNPKRVYCKKGCLSESEITDCLKDDCTKLCIKVKIGDDLESAGGIINNIKSEWTKFFSRAPADSNSCLDSCFQGCHYKISNFN